MNNYTSTDIENYYDQTEVHYRMFWKLEQAAGLHYGVWDETTKNIGEAILNTNKSLMNLGEIKKGHKVLDAGCGIGGSSIYLAKNIGCNVHGITLSKKQSETAKKLAQKNNLDHITKFSQANYLETSFEDNSFDVIWALESFSSCPDNDLFFKEMNRILKPGGKVLISDIFKSYKYDITKSKPLQAMLNGWAIADVISIEELSEVAGKNNFEITRTKDHTKEIRKSVNLLYYASILGFFGTKVYNFFKKATYFSRIHYTTGFGQKKAYDNGDWVYYMFVLENKE